MSTLLDAYSWLIAFTYPPVNAALCIAAILAARHPTFRRSFHLLAVAAGLSVFCSFVTLLFRLYTAFHWAFLPLAVRRSLFVLHDLAEGVSIVAYCIGFFALVRHVLTQLRNPKSPPE